MDADRMHFYICAYRCTTIVIKEKEAISLRAGGAQEELDEDQ